MNNNRTIQNGIKASIRQDFIEQGGQDGRFRSKVVKSAKQYNRNKEKKHFRKLDY